MLSDLFHNFIRTELGDFRFLLQHYGFWPIAFVITASCLLIWRFWTFTLLPSLYLDRPKQLPYWIPGLGHAFPFFNNSNALLRRARLYFANSDEPFALTAFGLTFYVITSGKHITEVYKNTDALSFEEFVKGLMKTNGSSKACVEAMFTPIPKNKQGYPNPQGKALEGLVRDIHIHQLFPGENLKAVELQFLKWFDFALRPTQLQAECPFATGGSDQHLELPLMTWCSEFLVRAGQFAYFGKALEMVDPHLSSTFLVYDDLSWQVLYQYPKVLTQTMRDSRDQIQSSIKKYLRLPRDQRSGQDGVWFIETIENEMRAVGFSEDDMASMLFTIYWGIHTNTRRAAFWVLTYLLHNPQLIDIVRAETEAAFSGDELCDLEHLDSKCPQLEAIWNETLRLSVYAASVRFITKDFVLGDKVLRKGNRLMIPYRLLHFDERIFGDSVHEFKPERFMQKEVDLTKSTSWRPFGGGKTMCTGRFAAKRAVLMFVAVLLRRFDISMPKGSSLPLADEGKPVLGIMAIQDGQDVTVRVRPRTARVEKLDCPIYTLRLPGSRIYVVNAAWLIPVVDRYSRVINFTHAEAKAIIDIVGISKPAQKILLSDISSNEGFMAGFASGVRLPLVPGPYLDELNRAAIGEIAQAIDAIDTDFAVPMYKWIQHQMLQATTNAVYGPNNPFKDNKVTEAFYDFEAGVMVLAANIFPSLLAKQAIKGREYVTRAFTRYYEAGHQNEASALVKFRYEHIAIKHKITNPEDNARFEVAGAFSVISNTIPVIFWAVFQIYSDPVVLQECREEVSRIVEDTNVVHSLDIKRLKDSSPVLQSTIYEVLRFHSILQSFREVLDDCLVDGNYLLKKKGLVILPAANAHFDKSVWGEDANIFNHKRFIHTGVGKRRMGFRGFGGGQVLCPGRHFAMTEILAFVALMILQYDAKPTSNAWSGVNYSKNPLTGAAYLAPEKDVEVLLHRRLSKKVAVVLTGSDDGMEMMEENTMDEEKFH